MIDKREDCIVMRNRGVFNGLISDGANSSSSSGGQSALLLAVAVHAYRL